MRLDERQDCRGHICSLDTKAHFRQPTKRDGKLLFSCCSVIPVAKFIWGLWYAGLRPENQNPAFH